MFEGVEFSPVYAGAFCGGGIPGVGCFEVFGPEWPGSALVGSYGIDGAAFLVVDFGEEDAIFIFGFFDDCGSKAYTFEKFLAELIGIHFKVFGEQFDFRFCNPDIAFVGACAAVAALETLKVQARDIPGCVAFFFRHDHFGRVLSQSSIVFTNSFPDLSICPASPAEITKVYS